MKRMVSIGIVSLLVIGGFLGLITFESGVVSAGTTLYVGGTGGGNYSKIQDAIDNASAGDTIFVYDDSAPYYEHVHINKPITLVGENRDTTIIDGGNSGYVVYVSANWVNVTGFTMTNGDFGIYLESSNNNTIFNNSANSNNYNGIHLWDSNYNNIFNNSANSNNYNGIHLWDSNYNNMFNNNASNNYNGIHLWDSSNNNIFNNSANSNNYNGIWLRDSNYNNVFNNNASSNNWYGIYLNGSMHNNIFNNSVSSNNYRGIHLESSNYNTFISNNISYNGCSVEIYDSNCENNAFHHNNFFNGTVVNAIDNGVNTKWDDGYGEGNYWSNYTGLDNGTGGRVAGDGVGDTNIPHMGLDNYPLMRPVEQPYTPDTTPPVISSVVVSEITYTTGTITWATDEFSDSRVNYSVNDDLSSNYTEYNSTLTTSHSITLTGLSPRVTYYFEVSSAEKYGNTATDSNNSNYYRFTTLEDTTPPTITDITAIPDPQEIYGYVNISANVSDNAILDTALIGIMDPNGGIVGNFTMTHDPVNDRYYKNQTYDIVGTYQFIIWANDTSNNWNFSSGQFIMQDTPPATPTGLIVTDVPNDEGRALNITWDLNTDDTVVYSLYSNVSGSWQFLVNVTHPQNWYVDTGLTNNVKYYYKISAWDEVLNESPLSDATYGIPTDNLPPVTPSGLTVSQLASGDLNITWNLNTDDTQTYSIYSNKTGTWTLLVNITHPQNWYVDTGLTNRTTYYYKISAWDEVPLESLISEAIHGVSSPMGTISGVVEDKDGNPIEGATVTVYEGGTTTDPVTSATTNSNGEYSVDLPPGIYDVKSGKSGYETQWEKDVDVAADQTTTVDFTLPCTTDLLRYYWWLILLIIIVIIIIIIVILMAKKKRPVEEAEGEEKPVEATEEEEAEEKKAEEHPLE